MKTYKLKTNHSKYSKTRHRNPNSQKSMTNLPNSINQVCTNSIGRQLNQAGQSQACENIGAEITRTHGQSIICEAAHKPAMNRRRIQVMRNNFLLALTATNTTLSFYLVWPPRSSQQHTSCDRRSNTRDINKKKKNNSASCFITKFAQAQVGTRINQEQELELEISKVWKQSRLP